MSRTFGAFANSRSTFLYTRNGTVFVPSPKGKVNPESLKNHLAYLWGGEKLSGWCIFNILFLWEGKRMCGSVGA